MWLKSCPRCGGDLYIEYQVDETNVVCLQCGHILTRAQEDQLRQPVAAGVRSN
jgi:transcription initiation factor TFIIIB Brf1 subunit/transcription initiation factor TFIIB